MKKKAIVIIAGVVVVAIAIGLISMLALNNQENELSTEDVVLEKNVSVITNETSEAEQPFKIDENHLYFNEKPDLKKDDVVVSGITEAAPTGFMRKIVSIEKSNGEYIAETVPANFNEVFKNVNFEETISLIEEKESDETLEAQPQSKVLSPTVTPLNQNLTSAVWYRINNKEIKDDDFYAYVSAEFDLRIKPKLQIVDGNVIFDILWENEVDGEIDFYNYEDISRTIEAPLSSHTFYPREFYIGNVPVVMTSEVETYFKVNGSIKGNLDIEADMHNTLSQGFLYDSNEESYSQNDNAEGIKNHITTTAHGPLEVSSQVGIYVKTKTVFFEGMSAENLSGFKADVKGSVEIDETMTGINGFRTGMLETAVLADNVVEFIPVEPIETRFSEEPISFDREDEVLWEDTKAFNGAVAPHEPWIASQFYKALDFYERNLYGRDYRVSEQEQPTAPLEGAILFNGEWLAPYPHNNFTSYEDFVDQCSEYFEWDTIEAIRHSIAGEDYKGAFYSRFHWGIGDWRNSDYNLSVKEYQLDEYTFYYKVYGSFENMAGEIVDVEMTCNYVDGKWVFDRCAFYGDDFN